MKKQQRVSQKVSVSRLDNQAGIGLIEMMMAVGILGLVTLAITLTMTQNQKLTSKVSAGQSCNQVSEYAMSVISGFGTRDRIVPFTVFPMASVSGTVDNFGVNLNPLVNSLLTEQERLFVNSTWFAPSTSTPAPIPLVNPVPVTTGCTAPASFLEVNHSQLLISSMTAIERLYNWGGNYPAVCPTGGAAGIAITDRIYGPSDARPSNLVDVFLKIIPFDIRTGVDQCGLPRPLYTAPVGARPTDPCAEGMRLIGRTDIGFKVVVTTVTTNQDNPNNVCAVRSQFRHQRDEVPPTLATTFATRVRNGSANCNGTQQCAGGVCTCDSNRFRIDDNRRFTSCDTDGAGYRDITVSLTRTPIPAAGSEKGVIVLCRGSLPFPDNSWRLCDQARFCTSAGCGTSVAPVVSTTVSEFDLTYANLPPERNYNFQMKAIDTAGNFASTIDDATGGIAPFLGIMVDSVRPQISGITRGAGEDDIGRPGDLTAGRAAVGPYGAGGTFSTPRGEVQCNANPVELQGTYTEPGVPLANLYAFTYNWMGCQNFAGTTGADLGPPQTILGGENISHNLTFNSGGVAAPTPIFNGLTAPASYPGGPPSFGTFPRPPGVGVMPVDMSLARCNLNVTPAQQGRHIANMRARDICGPSQWVTNGGVFATTDMASLTPPTPGPGFGYIWWSETSFPAGLTAQDRTFVNVPTFVTNTQFNLGPPMPTANVEGSLDYHFLVDCDCSSRPPVDRSIECFAQNHPAGSTNSCFAAGINNWSANQHSICGRPRSIMGTYRILGIGDGTPWGPRDGCYQVPCAEGYVCGIQSGIPGPGNAPNYRCALRDSNHPSPMSSCFGGPGAVGTYTDVASTILRARMGTLCPPAPYFNCSAWISTCSGTAVCGSCNAPNSMPGDTCNYRGAPYGCATGSALPTGTTGNYAYCNVTPTCGDTCSPGSPVTGMCTPLVAGGTCGPLLHGCVFQVEQNTFNTGNGACAPRNPGFCGGSTTTTMTSTTSTSSTSSSSTSSSSSSTSVSSTTSTSTSTTSGSTTTTTVSTCPGLTTCSYPPASCASPVGAIGDCFVNLSGNLFPGQCCNLPTTSTSTSTTSTTTVTSTSTTTGPTTTTTQPCLANGYYSSYQCEGICSASTPSSALGPCMLVSPGFYRCCGNTPPPTVNNCCNAPIAPAVFANNPSLVTGTGACSVGGLSCGGSGRPSCSTSACTTSTTVPCATGSCVCTNMALSLGEQCLNSGSPHTNCAMNFPDVACSTQPGCGGGLARSCMVVGSPPPTTTSTTQPCWPNGFHPVRGCSVIISPSAPANPFLPPSGCALIAANTWRCCGTSGSMPTPGVGQACCNSLPNPYPTYQTMPDASVPVGQTCNVGWYSCGGAAPACP